MKKLALKYSFTRFKHFDLIETQREYPEKTGSELQLQVVAKIYLIKNGRWKDEMHRLQSRRLQISKLP